jgi:hypothetical protein
MHYPWILPKLPGRFYYYFGKPIETEGMAIFTQEKHLLLIEETVVDVGKTNIPHLVEANAVC